MNRGRKISLRGQYLKELAFQSPKVPELFTKGSVNPNVSVNMDINANRLQKELFEVELSISIGAELEKDSIFTIELVYAGMFMLSGVEDTELEEVLFIECPSYIFPYARRIIGDVSRDGSLPPLMLDPVDFGKMYEERRKDLRKS